MTKFTKGPWHVDCDYSAIFNEQCNFICDVSSSADANLIAAAPEMYAVLIRIQQEGGLSVARHKEITKILAKALAE